MCGIQKASKPHKTKMVFFCKPTSDEDQRVKVILHYVLILRPVSAATTPVSKKKKLLSMVADIFNPSKSRRRGRRISVGTRPDWSIQGDPISKYKCATDKLTSAHTHYI